LNAEDHPAERVARRQFSHAPREKMDNGEEISAKCEAGDEAARQLVVPPAPHPDHVWWKREALEYLASADAAEGPQSRRPLWGS
jgi:hypothetical protein